MIEAKDYPFYGVQYHPEKGSFEWKSHLNINHSPGAIEADRYFVYFFLSETRKNKNHFPDTKSERKEFIYNYYPIQLSDSFVSVYIFSKPTAKDILRAVYKTKRAMNFLQNSTMIFSNKTSEQNFQFPSNTTFKSHKLVPSKYTEKKELGKELVSFESELERISDETSKLRSLMESIDTRLKEQVNLRGRR